MGLDMYLTREHYVKNWEHTPPERRHTITVEKGGQLVKSIKPSRITSIVEDVMYWRKSNAIHIWFVKNVQYGVDDCKRYLVSQEELVTLLEDVNRVLDNPKLAQEILPTGNGFFFGSTEYDAYYFGDLEETKKKLTELLAEPEQGDYYYQSSW